MSNHSSIVGGSIADRILNCPASIRAVQALPPSAEIPSPYAEEGTAMHAVMTALMQARNELEKAGTTMFERLARDHWLKTRCGDHFYDRVLTQEHIDSMIEPALEALDQLEQAYGGGFKVSCVETTVRFPGVPGAFGTVDLILVNGRTVLLIDWKFGQGIGVKAVYPDPAGDIVNAQLLFYTAGAVHTMPRLFTRMEIAAAIIQPRGTDPLTHTTLSRKELRFFIEDIENAILNAFGREPMMRKGEHCRFAPCKVNCPLWTGPLLELSAMGKVEPRAEIVTANETTTYGVYLAKAKQLADLAAMFKKDLDEQLHAYLMDGGKVPGWRLKAKTKQRQWIDEETVERTLTELGFNMDEIWQAKLQTFQAADATAKRLKVKIPDELRVAPATNETTVCPSDDPAPEVNPKLAIEQFTAALAAMKSA